MTANFRRNSTFPVNRKKNATGKGRRTVPRVIKAPCQHFMHAKYDKKN